MTPDAKLEIEALLKAVARAPQSLLMLDYDGTLAPFRKDPQQAFPYPGIPAVLQQIVRTGKTRVVIISGRNANEVIPLLAIAPPPEVWGLHGRQRLKPGGSADLPALDHATVSALAAAENWLRYQNLEHTAEFKAGSIAVHWRGMSENKAEVVRGLVLMGWTTIARDTGLNLLEFDGGIEISAGEEDKGDAVLTILSEMDPDTPAAYLGDDATDEHAFQAMHGRGLSVLVRPRWRATAAKVRLTPPDEVLDLLQRWLQACQEGDEWSTDTTMAVNA